MTAKTMNLQQAQASTVSSRSLGAMFARLAMWGFLLIMALLTLFPIVIAIFGSFKSNAELTAGATFLPSAWHWSNYAEVWKLANFSRYTWNRRETGQGDREASECDFSRMGELFSRGEFQQRI